MSLMILAVNVLLALGVCVFAVTMAFLMTPGVSSADMLEWLTHTPPCGNA